MLKSFDFAQLIDHFSLFTKLSGSPLILLDKNLHIKAITANASSIFKWQSAQVLNQNFSFLCEKYQIDFPLPFTHPDSESVAEVSDFTEIQTTIYDQKLLWRIGFIRNQGLLEGILLTTPDEVFNFTPQTTKQLPASQEYQEYLENILENLPGVVFWKDIQGVFCGCNNELVRFFKCKSAADIIGKTDRDFFSEEIAKQFLEDDRKVIKAGKMLQFDDVITAHDGTRSVYLTNKIPLRDKRGKIIGVLAIGTNITERKNLENILRLAKEDIEIESAEKFKFIAKLTEEVTGQKVNDHKTIEQCILQIRNYLENIIANMPGAVYWKNRNGVFLGCNDNLAKLFQLNSRRDVIGKRDADFMPPEDVEMMRRNDWQVMDSGKAESMEETAVMADNIKHTYLTNKVPLYDDAHKEVVAVLGISLDITDQKKAEILEKEKAIAEKNAEVMQTLAGSIAHELRTPLSVVSINLDRLQLQRGKLDFKDQEEAAASFDKYFHDTKGALKETAQMIDMLLVKIKSVASETVDTSHFTPCSMFASIQDLLERYPFKPSEQNIVIWQPNKEQDFTYQGDIILTRHVLYNLIKNALRALKEGDGGNITIRLNQHEKQVNQLIFRDTGPGIPAEFLPKIFNKFESSNPITSGSGLGLVFCQIVMQGYGGDITCRSELGKYTEFILHFPKVQ